MSERRESTITGADWRRSLIAKRARVAQNYLAHADIRRRASEARASYQHNTLTGAPADGAQGYPAAARGIGVSGVAHET